MLDIEKFKDYMGDFLELYSNKPIDDNTGGMKSPHLFNMYCVLKELNPKLIIESGVWKGQGTWLFEQACPEASIVSFDVNFQNLKYSSDNVQYINNDITSVDWKDVFENNKQFTPDNTLLFLDDHINFLERLSFLQHAPFKKIIFEDNYPPNQGDCISPKKIRECDRCVIDSNGNREWIDIPSDAKELFENVISGYQELPPIYKPDTTRWGDDWGKEYKTDDAHFEFNSLEKDILTDEMYDYTWICYMEK